MEMRKLPLFGGRLPQGCLMDKDDNITHIFDDSQLLPDRLRHLVRWWKDSRFKDAPPPTMGHVQTANGKRYDIPHHGQYMYREGSGIAHDDGEKRTIYNRNFKHVKTVNSNHLTPGEIYKKCKVTGKSLQGSAYDSKYGFYAVFGNKDRGSILVYDLDDVENPLNMFFNRFTDKWWFKYVKNWEAEGIRISKDGSPWVIVSFKTIFGYRINRLVRAGI